MPCLHIYENMYEIDINITNLITAKLKTQMTESQVIKKQTIMQKDHP